MWNRIATLVAICMTTPARDDYDPRLDDAGLALSGHDHEDAREIFAAQARETGETVEQQAEDQLEQGVEFGIVNKEKAAAAFAEIGTSWDEVTARVSRILELDEEHEDYDENMASLAGLLALTLGMQDEDEDDDEEEYLD